MQNRVLQIWSHSNFPYRYLITCAIFNLRDLCSKFETAKTMNNNDESML
jgi:hypothetical protein